MGSWLEVLAVPQSTKVLPSQSHPMLLTQTAVVDRVEEAILRCPHLWGRRLHVATDAGRVVLEGVVGSYYQKQMAQETIRRLDGVGWIENRLEVLLP